MGFIWYNLTILTFVLVANSVQQDETEQMASRPASLKPLTPIFGTNLFLNTVYKWHDHTKPGCYVASVNISATEESLMVCNREDQKWYDTSASDWILEREDGQDSNYEYNGTVAFKNVATNKYFDVRGSKPKETLTNLVVFIISLMTKSAQYLIGHPNNKNHLQIAYKNKFLAQEPAGNYRSRIILQDVMPANHPYEFLPAIKVRVRMSDFQFTQPMNDELAKHTSEKSLIDAYTINNNSPSTLSRTVKVSETVKSEFSWGFSEKFTAGTKVSGKAGIPFLAESEVEASFEMEIGANQETTNSVEKTFELSYDVNVLPHTAVAVSAWYDLIKGISMDYTATLEITGSTSRITVFNDVVPDTPASGIMIRNHLALTNFDGKIVEIRENSVIASFKGTMSASVGVRGRLNVNGITVQYTEGRA